MDEAKFIAEFTALTACSESFARSIYIHAEALNPSQEPTPETPEASAEAAAPAHPTPSPESSAG